MVSLNLRCGADRLLGFHVWLRPDHWEITAGLGTASRKSTQRPVCAPGLTLTGAQGLPASVWPHETSSRSNENIVELEHRIRVYLKCLHWTNKWMKWRWRFLSVSCLVCRCFLVFFLPSPRLTFAAPLMMLQINTERREGATINISTTAIWTVTLRTAIDSRLCRRGDLDVVLGSCLFFFVLFCFKLSARWTYAALPYQ